MDRFMMKLTIAIIAGLSVMSVLLLSAAVGLNSGDRITAIEKPSQPYKS